MTPDANTIRCPKCKAAIKLTDAVAGPLLASARIDFEQQLTAERINMLDEIKTRSDAIVREELATRTKEIVDKANQTAQAADKWWADKKAELAAMERKLGESQAEQARLLAKERDLDDQRRELELTVARRVNEEAGAIQRKAVLDADASAALKVSEKQILIDSLTGKIEELQRRAEQGDNRVVGEAQELVLESMLRAKFPMDRIEPVAKGVYGGDCLQTVVSSSGVVAGSILWESKRTKNWEAKWLPKLRDDQRAAKADIAALVTLTMPPNVLSFEYMEGIWVGSLSLALAIATVLRFGLLEVAAARVVGEGQATKMELLYAYLTGPRFKARVQAIVERFGEMAEDLRKERAATMRGWAKREGQIQAAADAAAGMHGDLTAIAGSAVAEVEGLKGIEEGSLV